MIHLVCLGHAKCGTTLLDNVFRQSSIVATPAQTKEIKFFLPRLFESDGARERYLDMFATANGNGEFRGTFEASPPYSHQPPDVLRKVLDNIAATLDDPRIVLCFRQPVLRAYSHYIHNLHSFGLYGEGVFNPRPDLLRKPCVMSFEEALTKTPRLATNYATALRLASEVFGRERVVMFFLERDAEHLKGWISRHIGDEIAKELPEAAMHPGTVFGRRPVPNYVADGRALHAFGSLPGEYLCYRGVDPKTIRDILEAPGNWTLLLERDEAARLTNKCFRQDLQECVDLTGEMFFLEYMKPPAMQEAASLSSPFLLQQLHGVKLSS